MATKFTHPRLGETVESYGGYYIPQRVERLPYGDRQVLYVLGYACIESS